LFFGHDTVTLRRKAALQRCRCLGRMLPFIYPGLFLGRAASPHSLIVLTLSVRGGLAPQLQPHILAFVSASQNLSSPMARPKIDKKQRAEFKEWARQIVARDRVARKLAVSQNTIGEIERALVLAFTLGGSPNKASETHNPSSPSEDFTDWIEIPPRARNALSMITIELSPILDGPRPTEFLIERFRHGKQDRWRRVTDRDRSNVTSFSTGAIAPLIKLGLLDAETPEQKIWRLTQKGRATCDDYWRRWSLKDPTLPIDSVRS
jgi:hypothetical protein